MDIPFSFLKKAPPPGAHFSVVGVLLARIHTNKSEPPNPEPHIESILASHPMLIFTIRIRTASITLILNISICVVAPVNTVMNPPPPNVCLVRVLKLLRPLLNLVIITQLPEPPSLEKNFCMGLEHILSLFGLAGEGFSIRFELFIGETNTRFIDF